MSHDEVLQWQQQIHQWYVTLPMPTIVTLSPFIVIVSMSLRSDTDSNYNCSVIVNYNDYDDESFWDNPSVSTIFSMTVKIIKEIRRLKD